MIILIIIRMVFIMKSQKMKMSIFLCLVFIGSSFLIQTQQGKADPAEGYYIAEGKSVIKCKIGIITYTATFDDVLYGCLDTDLNPYLHHIVAGYSVSEFWGKIRSSFTSAWADEVKIGGRTVSIKVYCTGRLYNNNNPNDYRNFQAEISLNTGLVTSFTFTLLDGAGAGVNWYESSETNIYQPAYFAGTSYPSPPGQYW